MNVLKQLLDVAPLLLLLGLGAVGHGLALRRLRVQPSAIQRHLLAATAQLALLGALLVIGLQTLGINVPDAWLPLRSVQVVQAAAWLALFIFLTAGAWWRSPGLGVSLPLLLLPLIIAADLARDASITRGLAVPMALRPAAASLTVLALALAILGCAGLFARLLEGRALGQPLLARRVVVGLLGGAVLTRTAQLGLLGYSWLTRRQGLPAWTLQDTWVLASWIVLLLAAYAVWRGRRQAPVLVLLGTTLLLLSAGVVAGLGTRS